MLCRCFQKSRNMELLEQELNDPNSPRPPPLPPRPAVLRDPRTATLPGVHSASAPSLMTSRNQSEDRDRDHEEPRYVSSPRPHRSAAAAANQLRRPDGLHRARTCADYDTPPALPQPRKFSLPLDSLVADRSLSPAHQNLQHHPHRNSPDSPSTPNVSSDRSPRSSPRLADTTSTVEYLNQPPQRH